jgi:hypothetical protein
MHLSIGAGLSGHTRTDDGVQTTALDNRISSFLVPGKDILKIHGTSNGVVLQGAESLIFPEKACSLYFFFPERTLCDILEGWK